MRYNGKYIHCLLTRSRWSVHHLKISFFVHNLWIISHLQVKCSKSWSNMKFISCTWLYVRRNQFLSLKHEHIERLWPVCQADNMLIRDDWPVHYPDLRKSKRKLIFLKSSLHNSLFRNEFSQVAEQRKTYYLAPEKIHTNSCNFRKLCTSNLSKALSPCPWWLSTLFFCTTWTISR